MPDGGELQVDLGAGAGLDAGVLANLSENVSVDDFVPSGATDASVTAPLPAAPAAGGGEPAKPAALPDGQTPQGATGAQPSAHAATQPNVVDAANATQAGDKAGDAAALPDKGAGADPAKVAGAEGEGAPAPLAVDPELSQEEQSVVAALDEAERPAAVENFKRGKHFMQFFMEAKSPEDGESLRSHMETRSPSKYGFVKDAMLTKELSDPAKFAGEYYKRDPAGYGKFIAAVMQGDTSGFFAKQLAGRADLTAEQIQTAVAFYDANKDRVPADGAAGSLSQDEIDAVAAEFPDLSDKLKSTLAAAGASKDLPADVTARLEKLQKIEEADKLKAAAGTATAKTPAAEAEALADAIYTKAYSLVDSYVDRKLDDAKDGLGLRVTDQERQSNPDVANLKDIKRHMLKKGYGDLSDFEDGLGHWGEKNTDFMKVGSELGVFSSKGEEQNALLQAAKLNPFADRYLEQRLLHPVFAWLDKQITAASERGGAAPSLETVVTGGSTAASGQTTAPSLDKKIDDWEPTR